MLNQSVENLTLDVGQQKDLSDRLSASLSSQKELLNQTILESRAEMERQNKLIDKQQELVQVSIYLQG